MITKKVQIKDTVKVHYTGKLEDQTVFDSSEGSEPLEFTIGSGQVIPGFENGIIGMKVGDKRKITIAADNAYGARRDELVVEVPKGNFPDNVTPAIGQQLRIRQANDDLINVTVTAINEDSVTLDANHQLAGKTLIFETELIEIA
ncbi:MAG: peptidylprolyl isomerase [Deltaproteobacteria bacterium]|nr:peptidylprolyl isomerase [Deltaproteobacteria bacterium]MBW2050846.1 peptidylprolyl isomerase [Deltaproteobacteria bacterium]MBW2140166.1 peptidylprolyl isomerase [Deltaproteobacteria bacterium]MBW2322311.1 peptidylprolyl isomerase [Deltaproteobacteria bacterium]